MYTELGKEDPKNPLNSCEIMQLSDNEHLFSIVFIRCSAYTYLTRTRCSSI